MFKSVLGCSILAAVMFYLMLVAYCATCYGFSMFGGIRNLGILKLCIISATYVLYVHLALAERELGNGGNPTDQEFQLLLQGQIEGLDSSKHIPLACSEALLEFGNLHQAAKGPKHKNFALINLLEGLEIHSIHNSEQLIGFVSKNRIDVDFDKWQQATTQKKIIGIQLVLRESILLDYPDLEAQPFYFTERSTQILALLSADKEDLKNVDSENYWKCYRHLLANTKGYRFPLNLEQENDIIKSLENSKLVTFKKMSSPIYKVEAKHYVKVHSLDEFIQAFPKDSDFWNLEAMKFQIQAQESCSFMEAAK